jgi:hypothetical protein
MAKPLRFPVPLGTRISRQDDRVLRLYAKPSRGEWLRALVVREIDKLRKRHEEGV